MAVVMEQSTAAAATTAAVTTAAASAAAAAATAVTGDGSLFTAHKGDADDREKHRDAQNQSTVHPRILQQKNRYLGVTNTQRCHPTFAPAWDGRQARIPMILGPMLIASIGLTRTACPV